MHSPNQLKSSMVFIILKMSKFKAVIQNYTTITIFGRFLEVLSYSYQDRLLATSLSLNLLINCMWPIFCSLPIDLMRVWCAFIPTYCYKLFLSH